VHIISIVTHAHMAPLWDADVIPHGDDTVGNGTTLFSFRREAGGEFPLSSSHFPALQPQK